MAPPAPSRTGPACSTVDAAETFSLLQRWEATPSEDAETLVDLLNALFPSVVTRWYQWPETEGFGLYPSVLMPDRLKRVHPHNVMAIGAFPRLVEKVQQAMRHPQGRVAFDAWTNVVLDESESSNETVLATLRRLLTLCLRPEIVWEKREIKNRLPRLPDHPDLVADLLSDAGRSLAFRSDILIHLFTSTSSHQFAFFRVMGTPGGADLLAHPPLRRFLWTKVGSTIETHTFAAGGMLPIFNLLVETAADHEIARAVDNALAADPARNKLAAAGWARILIGLEIAGRLAPLLPAGVTFESAYRARFNERADGMIRPLDPDPRGPPVQDDMATLADLRDARARRDSRWSPRRVAATPPRGR
ncbi:MAG: hypothetical protein U0974_11905 [Gemmatimonadales bacterium]|nr:hypothetical protein [Gemmatimonadales bacterium]